MKVLLAALRTHISLVKIDADKFHTAWLLPREACSEMRKLDVGFKTQGAPICGPATSHLQIMAS